MVTPAEFEREWREGDRAVAKEMATEYVAANRAHLARTLETMSREDIVSLIDQYRAAGDEENRIIADMWLLAEYEPQHITGELTIGGGQIIEQVEAALKEERQNG